MTCSCTFSALDQKATLPIGTRLLGRLSDHRRLSDDVLEHEIAHNIRHLGLGIHAWCSLELVSKNSYKSVRASDLPRR